MLLSHLRREEDSMRLLGAVELVDSPSGPIMTDMVWTHWFTSPFLDRIFITC